MNLRMLALSIITGLSVLHSILVAKTTFISLLFDKGTTLGFALNVIWLLGKVSATWILGWQHEKMGRLLESMEMYENTYRNLQARPGTREKLENLMYLAIGSTLGTALLEIWAIRMIGIRKALLTASHTFSKCLFIWMEGNSGEKSDQLEVQYGSELTVTTAAMGGILIASEIVSILQTGLVLGLMLLHAVTMHAYVNEVTRDIREFRGNRRMEKVEEWKRCPWKSVAFWRKLKMLQDVFEKANDTFDQLFKLLFVAGLIALGVFLGISFGDTPKIYYCIFLVNLLFLEVWFIYVGKIAEQNDEICEWIENCAVRIGRVNVDGVVVDPRRVLKDLQRKPIGLGLGRYIIRYTYHYLVLKIFNRIWVTIFGGGNDN